MVPNAKKIGTYVSLRKLFFSLRKQSYPRGNQAQITQRSNSKKKFPKEKSLNCPMEQFKPFFPQRIIMSSRRRNLSCTGEQFNLFVP